MNTDLKKIMTWVMSIIISIMLGLLSYTGQRIISGQDKMNETLTSILINQQDLNTRVIALEAAKIENDAKWSKQEESIREFWQTYDPQKRR
jgi:hypothetical protein